MPVDLTDWLPAVDLSYTDLAKDEDLATTLAPFALAIQCLSTGIEQPPARVTNLRALQQIGKPYAGYLSLSAGHNPREQVQLGFAGIPGDLLAGLYTVALDIELMGIEYAAVEEAAAYMQSMVESVCIYTSREIWLNQLRFARHPEGCKLWLAHWTPSPVDAITDLPFSRWTDDDVVAIQYQGATPVGDHDFDLDLINPRYWLKSQQPAPGSATDPWDALENAVAAIYSELDRIRVTVSRLRPR